jgi:hypothetical protein
MRLPLLTRLGNPRTHAHGESPVGTQQTPRAARPSRGPSAWSGLTLREGDEPNVQLMQFLERPHQVRQRTSPAVQAPHQHRIDLAPACCFQQLLTLGPLESTRAYIAHFCDHRPATLGHVGMHRFDLQWEGLLVVRRDASIQADSKALCHTSPLAKNPLANARRRGPVVGRSDIISRLV